MGTSILFLTFFIILASITVEAITEIVVKSELFLPFRRMLHKFGTNNTFFKWTHALFDCGYCFSVWVSAALAYFMFWGAITGTHLFVSWVVMTFCIHRLSNWVHDLTSKQ